MKTLLLIMILMVTLPVLGQDPINQITANGQRTGKWVVFHENGSIDVVRYYEPEFATRTSKNFFFEGFDHIDTIRYADTIHYSQMLLRTEEYEYSDNGNFHRIIETIGGEDPIFIYGPNKEIATRIDHFSFNERISSVEMISIEMNNNTASTLRLTSQFDSKNFSTDQRHLIFPPNESLTFKFQLTIEPGNNNYIVAVKNDSISIEWDIDTFGYHIKSTDLAEGRQLTVEDEFLYWRTGNEALLRLYNKDKTNLLKTVSLAREKTVIDLKEFRAGDYLVCMQDFGKGVTTCCGLKIEK